ncbi:MAG: DUF6625 family protein [Rhodothermales bacterium]|nr:DUF6625 family protein [Rhodothermales bacterium]
MVCCYFGALPAYVRLFLASCRTNPSIDFLFVSDAEPPPDLPGNVQWYGCSLEELGHRISDRLGFEVQLPNGRKLCEFKPTWGAVFEDLLAPFDFWGLCDIDVILGDLRRFLTAERLERTDLLSFGGPWWLSGAIQVYRNSSALRRLYARAPGHRAIMQDPTRYWWFDESCYRWDKRFPGVEALVAAGLPVSITDVAKDAAARGEIRLHQDLSISDHWDRTRVVMGEGGRLWDVGAGEERVLYHFVYMKKRPFFHIPDWADLPPRFFITRAGLSEHPPGAVFRRLPFEVDRLLGGMPQAVPYYARALRSKVLRSVGVRAVGACGGADALFWELGTVPVLG